MPNWSFGAAGAAGMSTMLYRDAKRIVARIAGAQDKPDEVGAGDAIRQAIGELNRVRWEYLTVRGTDIALVNASGLVLPAEGAEGFYTLPTPFKDPLSALISGVRALTYVPRSSWDPLTATEAVGGTYFYTNFNQGLSGKIQLLDPPTGADTLEIRYYRPIAVPLTDATQLDVPDASPLEAALIARATEIVATWRGLRSERVQLLKLDAERLLRKAMGDDVSHADFSPQFIPRRALVSQPIGPNATWPFVDGGGWW